MGKFSIYFFHSAKYFYLKENIHVFCLENHLVGQKEMCDKSSMRDLGLANECLFNEQKLSINIICFAIFFTESHTLENEFALNKIYY